MYVTHAHHCRPEILTAVLSFTINFYVFVQIIFGFIAFNKRLIAASATAAATVNSTCQAHPFRFLFIGIDIRTHTNLRQCLFQFPNNYVSHLIYRFRKKLHALAAFRRLPEPQLELLLRFGCTQTFIYLSAVSFSKIHNQIYIWYIYVCIYIYSYMCVCFVLSPHCLTCANASATSPIVLELLHSGSTVLAVVLSSLPDCSFRL